MTAPARLLYFGSREWIDVQPGWSLEDARRGLFWGHIFWGSRTRMVAAQLRADVLAYDGFVLIEGDATGADRLANRLATGNPAITCESYPVDTAIDGPWPAAGQRRNARMHRDGRPTAGRAFIVGNCGTPLSRGSAGMLAILRRAGVPVIVHRDDGIEVQS